MPATIAMATTKLSTMLPASSKPAQFSSSTSINQSTTSVSTISIPVSAFHDPASNVITITPYIFVKTATVAEQMQALRQDKKIGKPPEQPAGALRVKRRTDLSKLGLPDAKPASVSRRNARERNRVKQVNMGFETLREHVPNGKKNKKMSKVQTLRSAAQYIKDLYMILHGELPALGSPTLIDDNEPNSPIDNSMCSVSDTDNDVSLASPEPKYQSISGQQLKSCVPMESNSIHDSPISSMFSPNVIDPPSPQPVTQPQVLKQQPLIPKTEKLSVLQQHLSRGQLSQIERITNQMKYQRLQQQQTTQQLQQAQPQLEEHSQQLHRQEMPSFNPSALRVDPLTCTTVLGLTNVSSVLDSWNSAMTFTELSPVSIVDERCDNYVDVSPEPSITHLDKDTSVINMNNDNNNTDDINMDITRSPELLQPYLNDVNMNVINASQTDFDALQHYYKTIHNEHFKHAETSFVFDQDHKNNNNFLIGQNSHVVHSPAPSLGSTASTTSSETDVCGSGHFDYDNVDREALLDISNWISEICSQGMNLNESGHTQQASLAYSH